MSTNLLSLNSDDAMKMIIVKSHVGTSKCNFQVKQYQWKQRVEDGIHILDVKKIWERSCSPLRALLKFAAHTGATPIFGRFVPGSFTNQMQKNFKQPRLLVVSDCRIDYQAVAESALVNIPVISFCNTDSPMKYVDVAVPCNNKDGDSIGLMWWFLAREEKEEQVEMQDEPTGVIEEPKMPEIAAPATGSSLHMQDIGNWADASSLLLLLFRM
uniref:40S ribosomal protein SA n=1 Tax=Ditylenchus dipsaci TaxID=166011 RepID=A0A915DRE8_9BILA